MCCRTWDNEGAHGTSSAGGETEQSLPDLLNCILQPAPKKGGARRTALSPATVCKGYAIFVDEVSGAIMEQMVRERAMSKTSVASAAGQQRAARVFCKKYRRVT